MGKPKWMDRTEKFVGYYWMAMKDTTIWHRGRQWDVMELLLRHLMWAGAWAQPSTKILEKSVAYGRELWEEKERDEN